MLTIDGSFGEGGGQILRTALSLSMVTGTPFRIIKIRSGRKKPGLLRQHLTAVEAAAQVSGARVTGGSLGSGEISFHPGPIRPGKYRFSIGSAGSATLVFQTILPPFLLAKEPAFFTFEGGTHNPWAPPFDFVTKCFLPLIERMGPQTSTRLHRIGFFPAGGGKFDFEITPSGKLQRLDILDRGKVLSMQAEIFFNAIPGNVADREAKVLQENLELDRDQIRIQEAKNSPGPGNAIVLEIRSENITEIISGFGKRGVRAEKVAQEVVREALEYLESNVPVGIHLADQIILPLAMAGGGGFITGKPSMHFLTNVEIIRIFLGKKISCKQISGKRWRVDTGNPRKDE